MAGMCRPPDYYLLHGAETEIRGVYCNITGEISEFTHERLESELVSWIRFNGGSIIDIREVRYLDSSGIKMFCRLLATARSLGMELALVTNRMQDRILQLVRLQMVLPTAKTEEEAVVLLGGAPALRSPEVA